MRSLRTLTLVGMAALLLLSSACKPGRTAAGTGAPAPVGASATAPAGSAGAGAGGPGTVTVAITQPVTVSGHAGTSVSCDSGRIYIATAQSAVVQGYQVSFTVRVAGYRGPGSYPALVTLRLDGATGAVASVSAIPDIEAAITDAGGSFTVHATADNGATLDASLQWACS